MQRRAPQVQKPGFDQDLRLFNIDFSSSSDDHSQVWMTNSQGERRRFVWRFPEALQPAWADPVGETFLADRPSLVEEDVVWVPAPNPETVRRDLSAAFSQETGFRDVVASDRFLFDALFNNESAAFFAEDALLGGPPLGLLLIFDLTHSVGRKIFSLPWERLRHEQGYFQHLGHPILRSVSIPKPMSLLARPDRGLRISAISMGGNRLDLQAEIQSLEEMAQEYPQVHLDVSSWHEMPTALGRLREERGFRVLHFMGHGRWDESQRAWCLEQGPAVYTGRQLAERIGPILPELDLVVINCCHGSRVDDPRQFRLSFRIDGGLAGGLARLTGSIIAHHGPVTDRAARFFTSSFYGSLAAGHHPAHALRLTRCALEEWAEADERLAWSTPVHWLAPRAAGTRQPSA